MIKSYPRPLTGIESGLVTLNGRPFPECVQLVEERLVSGDIVKITDLMMPGIGYVDQDAVPYHDPYTGVSYSSRFEANV